MNRVTIMNGLKGFREFQGYGQNHEWENLHSIEDWVAHSIDGVAFCGF